MRTASIVAAGVISIGSCLSQSMAHAGSLQTIQSRGHLNCPVPIGGYTGRAEVDDKGVWRGLDADMCRAVGTAIFGTPDKVNFVPISWAQRFPSIQSGDIDIIIMATGWTLSRNTDTGLAFTQPYFFSGLQFLVHKDLGAKSPADLNGGTICTTTGTTIERQTADYMGGQGLTYKQVTYEKTDESTTAFLGKRCDAIANSAQALGIIAAAQPDPTQFQILPEKPLTLEAEAMAVKGGDEQMLAVANWTLTALVEANELGITSANVDQMAQTKKDDPRVAALLGITPGVGKHLGLDDHWVQAVIKSVGNYGEIYDRYLGANSKYKVPAGFNTLYSKGGLLYPLAID